MTLREALAKLKEGQYVAHNNVWTEHGQQLFLVRGKLCWTAGFTVGGEVSDARLASLKSAGEEGGYQVYDNWRGVPVAEE